MYRGMVILVSVVMHVGGSGGGGGQKGRPIFLRGHMNQRGDPGSKQLIAFFFIFFVYLDLLQLSLSSNFISFVGLK